MNLLRALVFAPLWKLLRWFLFQFDAEKAHRATVSLIHTGESLGGWPLKMMSGAGSVPESATFEVLGMRFASRVGLAAGFDKDAEIVGALPDLGFGFAEIGTVTPRIQPGNPLPRLFRDPAKRALFNQMGFNNLGAETVSAKLRSVRERGRLPANFRVGVNVGKNKDTPLESAADDYRKATARFEGLVDYLVINVSSPNTPGLRSLQSLTALKPIVEEMSAHLAGWKGRKPPLLLKIAPEIRDRQLAELIGQAESWGIDGWVLTNTLGGQRAENSLVGGWSGVPVASDSRRSLLEARRHTTRPIISVGGIMDEEEALSRIQGGASLVQLYTGWIYGGPTLPARIARTIAKSS